MEQLENRTLLAADLLVAVDGDGNLHIDAQNDDGSIFAIEQDTSDATLFRLTAGFDTFFSGPYANPSDPSEAIVSGVVGNIYGNLSVSNDVVDVAGNSIPGDVIFNMGGGDDAVLVNNFPSQIAGDLYVSSTSGGTGLGTRDLTINGSIILEGNDDTTSPSDTMILEDTVVGQDVIFGSGDGNFGADILNVEVGNDVKISGKGFAGSFIDTLSVGNDLLLLAGDEGSDIVGFGIDVGDNFVLSTGDGDDILDLFTVNVGGSLGISAGDGNDSLFMLDFMVADTTFVILGDGLDSIIMDTFDAGKALTIHGSGTNFIDLFGVQSDCLIAIVTSSGDDQVLLLEAESNSALVATGSGGDEVAIIDSAFESLAVELGKGNDLLDISGTSAKLALLFGGSGDDTLIYDSETDILFGLAFSF